MCVLGIDQKLNIREKRTEKILKLDESWKRSKEEMTHNFLCTYYRYLFPHSICNSVILIKENNVLKTKGNLKFLCLYIQDISFHSNF